MDKNKKKTDRQKEKESHTKKEDRQMDKKDSQQKKKTERPELQRIVNMNSIPNIFVFENLMNSE